MLDEGSRLNSGASLFEMVSVASRSAKQPFTWRLSAMALRYTRVSRMRPKGDGMKLFKAASPPLHHRNNPLNRHARWLTWSARARRFFTRCRLAGPRPCRPRKLRVQRCEPYGETLHLNPSSLDRVGLRDDLRQLATDLRQLPLAEEMILLRDLYDDDATPARVDTLLSWLRAELVEAAGDERAALFSPPTPVRGRDNGFLLHADLFVVDKLWLIFDDVPTDGSGRSTFVTRRAFSESLDEVRSLRPAPREQLRRLVHGKIHRDSFDRLYRLLHLTSAWHDELQDALERRTLRIPLRSGEGYLINDRFWLHGRDRVSQPVGSRRFRRLTFGDVAAAR